MARKRYSQQGNTFDATEDNMNDINSLAKLVDLLTVVIYKELPVDEKKMDFIRQIKDPYHHRVGDVAITSLFTASAPTLMQVFCRLTA
jgi:hypothetical protein